MKGKIVKYSFYILAFMGLFFLINFISTLFWADEMIDYIEKVESKLESKNERLEKFYKDRK